MRNDPDAEAAPRRPSLREAKKELTRETLVDAAQAAFEDDGYVNVTVDDIARRAGASRATFYLHFQGKAEILQAVLRKLQMREEWKVLLEHFSAIDEPTVDALQAWLDEYVDFYMRHPGIHRALHQAQAIEPEFTDAFLERMQGYIEFWQSLGLVKNPKSEDFRLAAIMMFALADQVLYWWLVHGFEADREKTTRALAESFHATLSRP